LDRLVWHSLAVSNALNAIISDYASHEQEYRLEWNSHSMAIGCSRTYCAR
jgi:hypothetical protein